MKVLQLIDSLNPGGAERVAVNFANSLASRIKTSYLCTTREEGALKKSLSKEVEYLYLNKKSTIDFKAILKLNRFIKTNSINLIHAHSSSFFLASIIKILNPKLILIWHDHYGKSEFLYKRPKLVLKWCSRLFKHIFVVNTNLESWCKKVLCSKSVTYLPNFAVASNIESLTKLKGEKGKRIICLANLREQKDHMNLLKAFKQMLKTNKTWTLHLVGQDFNDNYSSSVKEFIIENNLEDHVFVYGSCIDIFNILNQSDIGVLSSKSEGLPLVLLEYGIVGLPTITTNVGDCHKVISNEKEGKLIPSNDTDALANALLEFINDNELRLESGRCLQMKVHKSFSESYIMDSILEVYKAHQI